MIDHARLLKSLTAAGAAITSSGMQFRAVGVRNVTWTNQEGSAVCVVTLYSGDDNRFCHKTIKSAVNTIKGI